MSRYVIKFSKEGHIRYISHLDLLRLFKRSFKRAGVRLQHSQGFNPHPKMSFAQPLSLGYFSTGEYLEFDTAETYSTDDILEKINSVMPEGIHAFSCKELPAVGKTLAALTEYADYEIKIPLAADSKEKRTDELAANIRKSAEDYLSQEHIFIVKHQKKSGKDLEVDIRPMIAKFNGMVYDNHIMLTMRLAAGSTANLSPEAVLSAFCEFTSVAYDRAEVVVTRTEIHFAN